MPFDKLCLLNLDNPTTNDTSRKPLITPLCQPLPRQNGCRWRPAGRSAGRSAGRGCCGAGAAELSAGAGDGAVRTPQRTPRDSWHRYGGTGMLVGGGGSELGRASVYPVRLSVVSYRFWRTEGVVHVWPWVAFWCSKERLLVIFYKLNVYWSSVFFFCEFASILLIIYILIYIQ